MGITKFKADKPSEVFCHYCHRLVPAGKESVDHKIPITKGGTNEDSNLVWCCVTCNNLKSDMDYDEFKLRFRLTQPHILELEAAAFGFRSGDDIFDTYSSKWKKFQNKITIKKL